VIYRKDNTVVDFVANRKAFETIFLVVHMKDNAIVDFVMNQKAFETIVFS
jgi:hypothetical protein